jgi:hypothetical protein
MFSVLAKLNENAFSFEASILLCKLVKALRLLIDSANL